MLLRVLAGTWILIGVLVGTAAMVGAVAETVAGSRIVATIVAGAGLGVMALASALSIRQASDQTILRSVSLSLRVHRPWLHRIAQLEGSSERWPGWWQRFWPEIYFGRWPWPAPGA